MSKLASEYTIMDVLNALTEDIPKEINDHDELIKYLSKINYFDTYDLFIKGIAINNKEINITLEADDIIIEFIFNEIDKYDYKNSSLTYNNMIEKFEVIELDNKLLNFKISSEKELLAIDITANKVEMKIDYKE